jgi:hypothetical protein
VNEVKRTDVFGDPPKATVAAEGLLIEDMLATPKGLDNVLAVHALAPL